MQISTSVLVVKRWKKVDCALSSSRRNAAIPMEAMSAFAKKDTTAPWMASVRAKLSTKFRVR